MPIIAVAFCPLLQGPIALVLVLNDFLFEYGASTKEVAAQNYFTIRSFRETYQILLCFFLLGPALTLLSLLRSLQAWFLGKLDWALHFANSQESELQIT